MLSAADHLLQLVSTRYSAALQSKQCLSFKSVWISDLRVLKCLLACNNSLQLFIDSLIPHFLSVYISVFAYPLSLPSTGGISSCCLFFLIDFCKFWLCFLLYCPLLSGEVCSILILHVFLPIFVLTYNYL